MSIPSHPFIYTWDGLFMPKTSPSNLNERNKLIKIDLSGSIAEQINNHAKDAETFLPTFTDIVGDSLTSGKEVMAACVSHSPRN